MTTTQNTIKHAFTSINHGSLKLEGQPHPKEGKKVISVHADHIRFFWECDIDLMAIRGRYISSDGATFFDCEMRIEDYLRNTVCHGSGQLTDDGGVFVYRDKKVAGYTRYDRDGWRTLGFTHAYTFWCETTQTHVCSRNGSINFLGCQIGEGSKWVDAERIATGRAECRFQVPAEVPA